MTVLRELALHSYPGAVKIPLCNQWYSKQMVSEGRSNDLVVIRLPLITMIPICSQYANLYLRIECPIYAQHNDYLNLSRVLDVVG